MIVLKTADELLRQLQTLRQGKRSVGFVPTMGALHAGHASLVSLCRQENDITVVSVFVNPTQFNDKQDLENYPRDLDADERFLESLGTDLVFAPTAREMYPAPDTRHFSYPPITSVMEGPRRPGHFNGVCQVVSKLFTMIGPDRAYFGEKDYQQIAVIRAMVTDLGLPVQICACPIVREAGGLALSSRNAHLSVEERHLAENIFRVLSYSRAYACNHSVEQTRTCVIQAINALEGLETEYYEIVDGTTLQSITNWEDAATVVGCITVYCGTKRIRLIDNIKYKNA